MAFLEWTESLLFYYCHAFDGNAKKPIDTNFAERVHMILQRADFECVTQLAIVQIYS